MLWPTVRLNVSCFTQFQYPRLLQIVCFDVLYFFLFSDGGVLYVVNGPNRDEDLYVPIQGFTIRLADKALLQTWPSDKEVQEIVKHFQH